MIKLTKNQIKDNFLIVLKINDYEKVKYLFSNSAPTAGWYGKYGKNADVYLISDFDIAIVIGYCPFWNQEILDGSLKIWNDKAYKILNQEGATVKEKERALYNLKLDFYKSARQAYFDAKERI